MYESICIFEDNRFRQLYPLTLTRPVFDLRCGIFSLQEKLIRRFPQKSVYLLCRKYLGEIVKNQHADVAINELPDKSTKYCLFINGRLFADSEFLNRLEMNELIYTHKGTIVAALLAADNRERFIDNKHNIVDLKEAKDIETVEIEANLVNYPWDLINQNSKQIESDFADLSEGGQSSGNVSDYAILLNSKSIRIGTSSYIKAGADQRLLVVSQLEQTLDQAVCGRVGHREEHVGVIVDELQLRVAKGCVGDLVFLVDRPEAGRLCR